jgi:hypothetical protein
MKLRRTESIPATTRLELDRIKCSDKIKLRNKNEVKKN